MDEAHLPALYAERLSHPADGAPKLLVTARVLAHRRRHRDLFDRGDYIPLQVEGARSRHVVAFARTLDGVTSITVAGRLFVALDAARLRPSGESAWGDTRLVLPASVAAGPYRDALTGRVVDPLPTMPRPDSTSSILRMCSRPTRCRSGRSRRRSARAAE